jgi:outer membrane lipoprotein-sorting protein
MTYVLSRKTTSTIIFLGCIAVALAGAQTASLASADKFFGDLSASYGKVKDYEASFTWTQGKAVSSGKLSYKSPVYLRMDFSDPAGQVLNFNGDKLTFYSKSNEVILEQKYTKKTSSQLEGMVTSQGLTLWQRNYSIAWLTGPSETPLEDGSREMVVKLKLVSRATTSYAQMIVSVVRSTMLIRRVEGTLAGGERVVLDLQNVRVNQGVPDSRFDYDGPPYANVIPDWLFDPER